MEVDRTPNLDPDPYDLLVYEYHFFNKVRDMSIP
jgi:hypothetical protein